jgi:phosphonate transport system substrate-binding protein
LITLFTHFPTKETNMFQKLKTLLAAASILAMFTTGAMAEESGDLKSIRFGIIATDSADNLRPQWVDFISAMEAQTGYTVEPFFAPDYNGIIEAMRFDQIEIAYVGGAAAVQAVDRAGGEVFAQRVNAGNNMGYHTLLIVHRDSEIQSVDDIFENAGRFKAALGDFNSTSGYLVPNFYLFQRRGVVPTEAFASVTNSNHEAMMLAVANRTADFATISSFQPARMSPEVVEQVREVWRSPLIPSSPMIWRTNLPEVTKNKIRGFFLSYGQVGTAKQIAEARDVLARTSGGMEIWRGSTNHQLIPVRQLGLAKERAQIEQSTMTEAQKAERLAEIDAQMQDLETMVRLLAAGL